MRRKPKKKGELIVGDLRVGNRVRFSAAAYSCGVAHRGTSAPTTGTIVDGDRWLGLKVLCDGRKTSSWYHESFWDRINKPKRARLS